MFVSKGNQTMPTMTVAEEILFRSGSPTRYSLSPYMGMHGDWQSQKGKLGYYREMIAVPGIRDIIRSKDDFSFNHVNFIYLNYERDEELMDADEFKDVYPEPIHKEDAIQYTITSPVPPEYARRFEDTVPVEHMTEFLDHVLRNVKNNEGGYKSIKRAYASDRILYDDDGNAFNENELAIEGIDTPYSVSDIAKAKTELARCLYKMVELSKIVKVNMLSVIIAYAKTENMVSTVVAKPAFLLSTGCVYYADENGDCTTVIPITDDLAISKARTLWLGKEPGDAYRQWYNGLLRCCSILGIDLRNEDARRYTHSRIKNACLGHFIRNDEYVSGKYGSVWDDVYAWMKTVSLDDIEKMSAEDEINPYEHTLTVLSRGNIPSDLYRQFNSTSTKNLLEVMYYCDAIDRYDVKRPYNSSVQFMCNEDGFVVDSNSDVVTYFIGKYLSSEDKLHFTGKMYVHASGYAVYETIDDSIRIVHLGEFIHRLSMNDMENLNYSYNYIGDDMI